VIKQFARYLGILKVVVAVLGPVLEVLSDGNQ
jgi:hypothetical protein